MYNPGVNDISGQIMAQGISNLGGIIGNTITAYKAKSDENKDFQAKSKSVENLIKTHANDFGLSKEQLDAYLSPDPNEAPKERYTRLSGMIDNAVVSHKMQQMKAQQKQTAQMQAAFDMNKQLGQYQQGQGVGVYSPEVQKRMQSMLQDPYRAAAVNIQAAIGRTPDDNVVATAVNKPPRNSVDPYSYVGQEGGKPIHVTIDQRTGKTIGTGPMQPIPEVPNPLNEKIYADLSTEREKTAIPAIRAIQDYSEIEAMFGDKNGIITGAAANPTLYLKKLGNALGLDSKDVANTEILRAKFAMPIANLVKSFGSGTSITDNDRLFATQAAGGDISLEPATIKRLANLGKVAAQNQIEMYQQRLDSSFPDGSDGAIDKRARSALKLPKISQKTSQAAEAPAGIDATAWKFMTPEEQALFSK
jgi:hypothetical protein